MGAWKVSKIYLSSKGFKPEDTGAAKILNRQIELAKDKDIISFPEGTYYLTQTIQAVNKGLTWEGGEDTQLRVYHRGTGIVLTRNQGTSLTRMFNLTLSNNLNEHDNESQHGIECNVPLEINHVTATAFHGHGLYLWASVSGERPKTDVSHSYIKDFYAQSCWGSGIYIQGGDANGIKTDHCKANDCKGYGLWDYSFLGNLHDTFMAHFNEKGNYRIEGSVSSGTLVHCYSENGSPPDYFGGGVQVFGGIFDTKNLILTQHAAAYFHGEVYKAPYNLNLLKTTA